MPGGVLFSFVCGAVRSSTQTSVYVAPYSEHRFWRPICESASATDPETHSDVLLRLATLSPPFLYKFSANQYQQKNSAGVRDTAEFNLLSDVDYQASFELAKHTPSTDMRYGLLRFRARTPPVLYPIINECQRKLTTKCQIN